MARPYRPSCRPAILTSRDRLKVRLAFLQRHLSPHHRDYAMRLIRAAKVLRDHR